MGNDFGFLLIFIILPTALIVSGFWLIVFVRRDARLDRNPPVESGAQSPELDDVISDASLEPSSTTPEAEVQHRLGSSSPDEIEEDVEEDFWSEVAPDGIETPDPSGLDIVIVDNTGELASRLADFDPTTHGRTEDLSHVADAIDLETGDQPDSSRGSAEIDPSLTQEQGANDPTETAGDTMKLPDEWEADVDLEDGETPTDETTRRRRQPGARMVPSSENVQRRTGTPNKRIPPISRSTTRDEDPVEGTNSC